MPGEANKVRKPRELVDYETYLPDEPQIDDEGKIIIPVGDNAVNIARNIRSKLVSSPDIKSKILINTNGNQIVIKFLNSEATAEKLKFYQTVFKPALFTRRKSESVDYQTYLPDEPEINDVGEIVIDAGADASKIANNIQTRLHRNPFLNSNADINVSKNNLTITIIHGETKADKLTFYQTELKPRLVGRQKTEVNYADFLPHEPQINDAGEIVIHARNNAGIIGYRIQAKLSKHPDLKSKTVVNVSGNTITIKIIPGVTKEEKLAFYQKEFRTTLINSRYRKKNSLAFDQEILDAIPVTPSQVVDAIPVTPSQIVDGIPVTPSQIVDTEIVEVTGLNNNNQRAFPNWTLGASGASAIWPLPSVTQVKRKAQALNLELSKKPKTIDLTVDQKGPMEILEIFLNQLMNSLPLNLEKAEKLAPNFAEIREAFFSSIRSQAEADNALTTLSQSLIKFNDDFLQKISQSILAAENYYQTNNISKPDRMVLVAFQKALSQIQVQPQTAAPRSLPSSAPAFFSIQKPTAIRPTHTWRKPDFS